MLFKHLEYIVCGRKHHFFTVCKSNWLQNINSLRNVSHFNSIRMFVKDVKRKTCYNSITHSIELIKEAGICAWLNIVPCSPFINYKVNSMAWVILAHNFTMACNKLFHLISFSNGYIVIINIKLSWWAFVIPIACRYGVVVKWETVSLSLNLIHNLISPMIIVYIRTAGNSVNLIILVIISYICIITLEKAAVIFGVHFTAATPAFVTYAEIFNFPRLLSAVFLSEWRHRRITVKGHIFNPFIHLFNSTWANIAVNISITAKLWAEFKKLMSAERVVLYNTAPVRIYHSFSSWLFADTVFPMIFISKASARPAKNGNTHFFKCVYNIASHTVDIGEFWILANIKTLINTSSKMLRKMAVNIFAYFAYFLIRINQIFFHTVTSNYL